MADGDADGNGEDEGETRLKLEELDSGPPAHLARVGVELLEDESAAFGALHHLVAVHVVKIVLAADVLLLKARAEGVAVFGEQLGDVKKVPRELQHRGGRHDSRQHREAGVTCPTRRRLGQPLQQGRARLRPVSRREARRVSRRLALLAIRVARLAGR